MSDSGRGCVVVGAGLAAATVAQTLRDGGFKHPVTLIGEESERPYERPALSKDYLRARLLSPNSMSTPATGTPTTRSVVGSARKC